LRVTAGEELVGAYEPPDGFAKHFCSVCGSALWSRDPANPDVIGGRLGAFDGDPGIRPSHRQYVDDAAVWEPLPNDGLQRFSARRTI